MVITGGNGSHEKNPSEAVIIMESMNINNYMIHKDEGFTGDDYYYYDRVVELPVDIVTLVDDEFDKLEDSITHVWCDLTADERGLLNDAFTTVKPDDWTDVKWGNYQDVLAMRLYNRGYDDNYDKDDSLTVKPDKWTEYMWLSYVNGCDDGLRDW